MGSIPAGNIRESYKPCKNRDNADCASLLANKPCCSYFYRAPARDRRSEASEAGMACSVGCRATPAMKKTEGLRIRRRRARLTYYRAPARDEEDRRSSNS